MTKNDLITKQQMKIETLKVTLSAYKDACNDVRNLLYRSEQWSIKCPDFPKVAMKSIVQARQAIEDL